MEGRLSMKFSLRDGASVRDAGSRRCARASCSSRSSVGLAENFVIANNAKSAGNRMRCEDVIVHISGTLETLVCHEASFKVSKSRLLAERSPRVTFHWNYRQCIHQDTDMRIIKHEKRILEGSRYSHKHYYYGHIYMNTDKLLRPQAITNSIVFTNFSQLHYLFTWTHELLLRFMLTFF